MTLKNKKRAAWTALGVLFLIVCRQSVKSAGEAPVFRELVSHAQSSLYEEVLRTHMPVVTVQTAEETKQHTLWDFFQEKLTKLIPICGYAFSGQEYDTQVESALSYEMLVVREGVDELYRDGGLAAGNDLGSAQPEGGGNSQPTEAGGTSAVFAPGTEPVVQISREKLNDFDYLIQNFYTVDRTTTIDGSLLNAGKLLGMDMHLTTTAEQPQILIHHTHSQEMYVDSDGSAATSIVGVGEYLAKLLRERYGYNVIHDTGEYDMIDHDHAYSYAGPATEQILAENPSIEVVIDVHRDGILKGHLVTEVNGKQTAQIMFFNGLSRTTSNGELAYLYNPYIAENLAFSLQTKLMGEEYYPDFTRANYLKGYRYNLHYRPKSMLVEVGAQTNTVAEAMNAMEPLADMLHKVLGP